MGLKINDLEDLILPTISIDEFESKIESDAIVVAFYAKDQEPAEDLSQFIESGMYGVLDTEVSPGTDQEGNYAVFVEFLRNEEFPKKIKTILNSIKPLTGNDNWQFTYIGNYEKIIDFSIESVKKFIRLHKKDEDIKEFFKESMLDYLDVNSNKLVLGRNNYKKSYNIVDFGSSIKCLLESNKIQDQAFDLSNPVLWECNKLKNLLGSNWDINKINEYYILSKNTSNDVLIVK